MKIDLKKKLTVTPVFKADKDETGYAANLVGYFRMYFKDGFWYGTAFPVHKWVSDDIISEFNAVIAAFRETFKTKGKMTDFCMKSGAPRLDWCHYGNWVLYMTLDHAAYEFDFRECPGDYNLYLRCYEKEVG